MCLLGNLLDAEEIVVCDFEASFRYCIDIHTRWDRPLPLAIDHGHTYFLTSSTIDSTDTACACVQRYRSAVHRSIVIFTFLLNAGEQQRAACREYRRYYKSSSRKSITIARFFYISNWT